MMAAPQESPPLRAGGQVAKPKALVFACPHGGRALGHRGHSDDVALVRTDLALSLAGCRIPDREGAVPLTDDHALAVGSERHRPRPAAFCSKAQQFVAGGNVPQSIGSI